MGNSQQQESYNQIQAESGRVLGRAYGMAIPAEKARYGYLEEALKSKGEPQYMKDAYNVQRTGLTESAIDQQRLARQMALQRSSVAAQGGNLQAATTAGQQMGSKLADALYGSRVNEAMGGLEQVNKLYQSMIGQSVQTGNAAAGASASQLQLAGNLPAYNKTYSNVIGALNLGGSIYGAGQQGGWFDPSIPQGSNMTAANQGVNPLTGPGAY